MKKLASLKTMEETILQYNEHLYMVNKKVTLKKGEIKFDTVIKEVSAKGHLVTVDAIEKEFDFGEVEWVIWQLIIGSTAVYPANDLFLLIQG